MDLDKRPPIPGVLGNRVHVRHCTHAQEIVEKALVSYSSLGECDTLQAQKENTVTNL